MAHRVLTVCGLKGGIGKSAVATNLAAWWSAAGQRVLLIDADPNGSATKLHARGEGALLAAGSAVAPIQQAPMAMAKPWDLVVVDTAGGSRDELQQPPLPAPDADELAELILRWCLT